MSLRSLKFELVKVALAALLAGMLMAGCKRQPEIPANAVIPAAADQTLRGSSPITLFSLEPLPAANARTSQTLHGWNVLGSQQLVESFHRDVSQWDGSTGLCFSPRHALQASMNNVTYDFVICYECKKVEIYEGDQLLATVGIGGAGDTFNKFLDAANISRASVPEPLPLLRRRSRGSE